MPTKWLAETDTYIFPYWWHAATRGREEYGLSRLTGGLYGPVLGGHNNVPDKGHNSARLRALARYLAGGSHPANGDSAAEATAVRDLIFPTTYHRLWCFTDTFHERYPFTQPDLVRMATALPLRAKVHNILHQAVIRRIAPELLRYPMAATLVPAWAPITVQELSRMQRIVLERVAGSAHRLSKGLVPKPRLGWPAFQFLRDHQPFHDIVDSLQMEIWDKSRIHRVIRESTGSLHPLFDMVGKCKTADYRMSAGS